MPTRTGKRIGNADMRSALLIVVGLALVVAVVNVLLGGWETPAVAELYPEWPT